MVEHPEPLGFILIKQGLGMSIFPEKRPGRVRVACVEKPNAPRDTVVIAFELDRSQPSTDADRIYEAMQFVWQMVPEVLGESSLHALYIEVAVNVDPNELMWETVLCKNPLANNELIHTVLGYSRKLAERCARQVPRVPLTTRWDNPTAHVLDMLARITGRVTA